MNTARPGVATRVENQRLLARAMSEAELQANVIDAARKQRWRVAHFRPAQTKKGWRTPVEADGKGFPDLVLLRGSHGIAAELKSEMASDPTREQAAWLWAFDQVTGFSAYTWRPHDWYDGTIEEALK